MQDRPLDDRVVDYRAASLASAGPLVNLNLSLSGHPWRISPGWAVVAGALAAGIGLADGEALLRLFAAVLLAELAWGSIIQLGLVRRREQVAGPARSLFPYTQPGTPAASVAEALGGRPSDGIARSGWYDLGVGLALAIVLGLLLGKTALVLTGIVLIAGLIVWMLAQRGVVAALLLSVLGVALPWILGGTLGDVQLPTLGIRAEPYVPLVAYTVLGWGVIRASASGGQQGALIWIGQAAVIGAALVMQLPWLIAVLSGLLVAPSVRLAFRPATPVALHRTLLACMPWWWACMMATALALWI